MIDFLLIFLYLSNAVITQENPDLIIEAPVGKIRGSILKSRFDRDIYSFRGIRYAEAPVNDLRFKPPVPIKKLPGIYNATEDGPACPQLVIRPVSEDCLMLNVYTTKLPTKNTNPNRPVIVFFHPGGWYIFTGRSDWFGPRYFLDRDIVLVTVNYRLGSLGLLSTGDEQSPGNNALKDQVVALRWVKENIAAFGGNPDSVTISGGSAGAASVTLHMVSPMSRGLFHKAIAISGAIFGNWPIDRDQLNLAKRQAQLLDCPDNDSKTIIDCLRNKSAEDFGNSLLGFTEWGQDPILRWNVVIEKDFGQERFLTEHPIKSVLEGRFEKVPFLAGVTTDEFAQSAYSVINNSSWLQEMDADFLRIFPISFEYERDTANSKFISRCLKEFYFGHKPMSNESLKPLEQLYADALIGFGANRAVKLISEKSDEKVYYYRFNYKGRYSYFEIPGTNTSYPGVNHQDDLAYLFDVPALFAQSNETDSELKIVKTLTSFHANFALTGNPTPDTNQWTAFTCSNNKYLDIGEDLVMKENLYKNRYEKWENLFPLSSYV